MSKQKIFDNNTETKTRRKKIKTEQLKEELLEFFSREKGKGFIPDQIITALDKDINKRTLIILLKEMTQKKLIKSKYYPLDVRSQMYGLPG
jgi:hypothetical protein